MRSENAKIVAFCCQRSGILAAEDAASRRLPLPENLQLVSVPCAGRVDITHLLKAFEAGAGGVLVFACHQDSCASLRGNAHVEKRISYTKDLLEEIGLNADCVEFFTLAPPMGNKFAEAVCSMAEKIGGDKKSRDDNRQA